MPVKNEDREGKVKGKRGRGWKRKKDHRRGLREKGRVRRRKNCKSGGRRWRGTVCGGRWSAVVRCKSPSTAFNYDVIANTDDGYFLRYTLYITRGPTAVDSRRARTKGRALALCLCTALTY